MHSFTINASIQVIPVVQDKHPYEWVDEVIALIKRSGIKYEVGPFATIVEGTYADVWKVINGINDYLTERKCAEWICNIQLHIRSERDCMADEKVLKQH